MSAYTNLMGVVDAGKNGYEAEYLIERGRGYSSDAESWAELKKQLELLSEGMKDVLKVHKEMWDAAKESNDDAFRAFCGQMARSAVQMAAEFTRVAAMADIALQ